MKIGRRIYFDITAGNILIDTGERQGDVIPTSIEQDISTYTALTERNRESFDVLDLPYGAFAQDFAESNGYRVNPQTKELEFSYPDPNNPEVPVEYIRPLSMEVNELKQENIFLKAQMKASADRADFQEEVITEMIMTIMP